MSAAGDGMILQLDLSDNISLQDADHPEEMEKLTKTMCLCLEHNRTLLALEFANNHLGYYGPYPLSLHAVDYFKDVIKALPKSSVRRLDISGNYILGPGNKILSTWALLLRKYCKQQCEVLRARHNGISSPALSLVTSILGPAAIIEEIDLNDNMAGASASCLFITLSLLSTAFTRKWSRSSPQFLPRSSLCDALLPACVLYSAAGLDAFGNVNSEGVYSFTRVLGMSPRLSILKLAR